MEQRSNSQSVSELIQHTLEPKPGTIEGKAVTDVCVDNGCTNTSRFSPHRKVNGRRFDCHMLCLRRYCGVYPLAKIVVEVNGTTHAAVSKTLSLSILMGTDIPLLPALVADKLYDCKEADTGLVCYDKSQEESSRSRRSH